MLFGQYVTIIVKKFSALLSYSFWILWLETIYFSRDSFWLYLGVSVLLTSLPPTLKYVKQKENPGDLPLCPSSCSKVSTWSVFFSPYFRVLLYLFYASFLGFSGGACRKSRENYVYSIFPEAEGLQLFSELQTYQSSYFFDIFACQ